MLKYDQVSKSCLEFSADNVRGFLSSKSNSLFRKVFVLVTSAYIEGHRGRIPKQLTVILPSNGSHQSIFDNMMKS